MKNRNHSWLPRASNTLLALAFCLQLPLAAMADNGPVFTPETATIDTTPSASQAPTPTTDQAAATPAAASLTLQGSARKHLKPLDGAALAAQKLAAGAELTSDEFRSLGAGCVGYESDRTFFQNIAIVSIVYKDSPAAKAGIRKGDKLIENENDDEARAHPDIPRQEVSFDQAGTSTDITVLRHGHPETLTLVRMNIEDIQEPKIRQEWERIIQSLGNPKRGNFSGTSWNNLSQTDKP